MKLFNMGFFACTALMMAAVPAHAGGDAVKGELVFKRCALCHNIKAGEPNKIGPNLHGLFDREAGKEAGFKYSAGLSSADFKWDDAKLDKWLMKPQDFIAGAKMPFNLPNAQERADVISYLHKAAEAP
jgi:cytochrome c